MTVGLSTKLATSSSRSPEADSGMMPPTCTLRQGTSAQSMVDHLICCPLRQQMGHKSQTYKAIATLQTLTRGSRSR
jgi:hypothetical protein